MVYNAGVKRQIAMSFGFEFTRNPEAISDLIRDEQIKVTGCRFAQSPFTPLLNDFPLRCVCESIIVVTPALINLERSGRLINVWRVRRDRNDHAKANRPNLNRDDSDKTNHPTYPLTRLLWAIISILKPVYPAFPKFVIQISKFLYSQIELLVLNYL